MRAVLVSEFGGPEQLRPVRVADPVAGAGQVRGGGACGRGQTRSTRATGPTAGGAGLRVPCILGYDIAGVIDGVGPRGHRPGARGPGDGDDALPGRRRRVRRARGHRRRPGRADQRRDPSFADAAATPLAAGNRVPGAGPARPATRQPAAGTGALAAVWGCFLLQLAAAARDHHDRGRPRGDARADARPGRHGPPASTTPREDVAARAPGRWPAARSMPSADLVGGRLAQAACAAPAAGRADRRDRNARAGPGPRCSMPTSPSTACSSRTTGTAPARLASRLGRRELRPVISRVLPLDAAAEAHRILEAGHAGGKDRPRRHGRP